MVRSLGSDPKGDLSAEELAALFVVMFEDAAEEEHEKVWGWGAGSGP